MSLYLIVRLASAPAYGGWFLFRRYQRRRDRSRAESRLLELRTA